MRDVYKRQAACRKDGPDWGGGKERFNPVGLGFSDAPVVGSLNDTGRENVPQGDFPRKQKASLLVVCYRNRRGKNRGQDTPEPVLRMPIIKSGLP